MRKLWKKILAGMLIAGMTIAPVSGTIVANAEPDTLLITANPNAAGKTWDFSKLNKEFGGPGIVKEGNTTTYSGLVLTGNVTEERAYLNLKEGAVVSVPVKKGDLVTVNYCYEAAFQIGAEVPATYKVVKGDTLSQIARKYSLTLTNILKLNPAITNPDIINIGQVINLAEAKATVSVDAKSGNLDKIETVTYTATADGYVDIKAVKGTKAAQTLLTSIVVGTEKTETPEVTPEAKPTVTPEVPADADAILDAAYALEEGAAMDAEATLTGVITKINTKYSSQYKNITVTIVVGDDTERPMMCYRLKGDGVEGLAVGDTVTVTGTIKNYYGTIEFDAGCVASNIVKGEGVETPEVLTDAKAIIEAAYALEEGDYLPGEATLTGKVTKVKTEYSDYYKNVTVIIAVPGFEDYPIECFRLAGTGADKIDAGDIVTVTGTLMNYYGTIEFDQGCTLDKLEDLVDGTKVPNTAEGILMMAYALGSGGKLPGVGTLDGTIIAINTEYSSRYKNITVTIELGDYPDYPVMCYRLKGDGAETLKVGDYIGVTGTLTNYKGTIEFNAGCTLDYVVKLQPDPRPETPQEIMDAAAALEKGEDLAGGTYTLTGVITAVNTAYSSTYKNVTVTMSVDGTSQSIKCYRLAGTGADVIGVGDTITVTGTITNYNGNIQFAQGCTIDSYVENTLPTTPEEILEAAYALGSGETLTGTYTLTGEITSIDTAYNSTYKNITVTIVVGGDTSKPIQCYRMAGTGADTLEVGDTITATGTIKNYSGTVEFDKPSLDSVVKPMTAAETLEAAYALASGESLSGTHTLTGVITKINTAYSSSFKNITVTIVVGGDDSKPMMCYRMKGTGADVIAVGDTITVSGTIKNYNGTIEFDSGCTLDSYVQAQ